MRLSSADQGTTFSISERNFSLLLLDNTALPVAEAQLAFLPSHSLNCKSFLSHTTPAHSMWSPTVFQWFLNIS